MNRGLVNRSVLTAVADRWEGALVTALERGTDLEVVRRCADLPDLLAAAASGLGQIALVSAELRSLDRTALEHLRENGVAVVGVYAPGDEQAERHLRQLGISTVLAADASGPDLQACLDALEGGTATEAEPWEGGPDSGAHETASPASDRPDGAGGEDPGTIIAVWGPTGAPGRTTVAINVASELARHGADTVLVDADTYGGSIAQSLSLLDEAPGLAAASRSADHGTLDLPALARLAPEVLPGLRVLTGIPKAERWPELRAAAMEHVLRLTRRLARFTIVDCGFSLEDDEELSYDTLAPRRNAATLSSLAAADRVIAVGAADPIGLQRLVRGLQELGATAGPAPTVVVNKVRASAAGARPEQRIREALARFAGLDDVRFVPDDRDALDAALLAGRCLAEVAVSSPARLALVALAAEIASVPAPAVARQRRGS